MRPLGPTQFFGKPIVRRQLSHLFIADNVYSESTRLEPHAHEMPFLAVCVAGAYFESVASNTYERLASTAAFHPAHERHSSHTGPSGARVISVVFSPAWMSRFDAFFQSAAPKSFDLARIASVVPRLQNELHRTDAAASLVIEACVLEILATMIRLPAAPRGRWLAAVLREIESRFHEPLRLSSLAEIAGIHPVHLAREFRKRTGRTIGQYVRELRVLRACDELRSTELPLTEIALRAGFADQSHLGRWVKRLTGMSPRRLRLERSKS